MTKKPGADLLDGLEELSAEECWSLLARQRVGRIAVIVGHYPLVFPVNYALDGRHIIVQTGVGAKLWSIQNHNVSFQIDSVDPDNRTGWSVLVRGAAHEISAERNPELRARAEAAGAMPWAPGEREHLISITVDGITGRRILRPRP
jgi:uncharacterized protein